MHESQHSTTWGRLAPLRKLRPYVDHHLSALVALFIGIPEPGAGGSRVDEIAMHGHFSGIQVAL